MSTDAKLADLSSRWRQKQEAKAAAEAANKIQVDPAEVLAIRQRITGVLIRDARVAKGFTSEQVAALMQVSHEELVGWEFGQLSPSLPQLELLAYWLEVPVSHFISGTTTLIGQVEQRHLDQNQYLAIRNRMIGVQLLSARENAGFTIEYLAEQVNLEPSLLQHYEYGHLGVPLQHLMDIARAVRVTVNYFLEGSDRVGAFIQAEELFKTFLSMKPHLREFIAQPSNQVFVELAMKLAEMDTAKLRQLAEMILDITLQ